MAIDPWRQPTTIRHSLRLLRSFAKWTGRSLLGERPLGEPVDGAEQDGAAGDVGAIAAPLAKPLAEQFAEQLFAAPFVVVSHGTEADPILNYGNQAALALWQLDWDQFTQTPSRLTAEPVEREERERLLQMARTQGYISDYRGVRIASTGMRFWIEDVVIWTVLDEVGEAIGQAAMFEKWRGIEAR